MSRPLGSIGRYELLEYLGGGMSMVYRACDTQDGSTVVVKVLKNPHLDPDASRRFLLEAEITRRLVHPNIVRTFDVGYDENQCPYMVLEYLKGLDLSESVNNGRLVSFTDKARVAADLADALNYIHSCDLIHRDFKPGNIILVQTPAGLQVKLIDFGIARAKDIALTQTGTTLGTPSYMAPEQIRAGQISRAIDIYAYGVVLWELFTGERAFPGPQLETVFYQVFSQPLDAAKLTASDLPPEIAEQILQCADKDPALRPPDLRQIGAAFRRFAPALTFDAVPESSPSPETPPPSPNNDLRKYLFLAGALAVCLLLLFAGNRMAAKRSAPNPPNPVAQTAPPDGMVLIPEGEFLFGNPPVSAQLPAFYIDRTEVSNGAYAAFAKATGRPFAEGPPTLPVVNVSLDDAKAYAAWAGKAIPTSAQWEKAARGTKGQAFPWGDQPDPSRANVRVGDPEGTILPVDTHEATGASPFGLLNTVGNVWEWVLEPALPSPVVIGKFARILTPPPTVEEPWVRIRGGSYIERLDPKVMSDSAVIPARFKSGLIGFRCIRPVKP